MSDYLDVVLRVLGAAGFGAVLVTVVGKKVTPRRSPAEQHDSRVAELERARTEDHKLIVELRDRIESLERGRRTDSDYIHDLRAHISQALGPPPPDYPTGVRP